MGLNQVGVNDSSTHQTAQVTITTRQDEKKKEKGALSSPHAVAAGSKLTLST